VLSEREIFLFIFLLYRLSVINTGTSIIMSIVFNKKYKLDRSENFDEFLKELGKRCLTFGLEKITRYLYNVFEKISHSSLNRMIVFADNNVYFCLPCNFSIGVNYLIRKMAGSASSTVELVKLDEPDTYSFNTISTFRTQTLKFKVNEEFSEKRMDGQEVTCTITFEGNKMIQKQTGDKPVTIEREFTDDELIATCYVGNVVSKRWFKAC
jgi:fatty acid-binding protein 3, muscle and heart